MFSSAAQGWPTWGDPRGSSTPAAGVCLPRRIMSGLRERRELGDGLFHLEKNQSATKIPIEKLLTPAQTTDDVILPRKNKTMFVDSSFFSPKQHPTWEQQVTMAKKIAASLSDARNRYSKGQSMFERRQKRSTKWIHQGGLPLEPEDCVPTVTAKSKPLLKLVMNPHGQVYDLEALRKEGEVINGGEGLSPEVCQELVKDLHAANGRGGQIFAKRKKRSEKWVVDENHPEQSRPGERPTTQLRRPVPTPPIESPAAAGLASAPPPVLAPAPAPAPAPGPAPAQPSLLGELCRSPQVPRFPTDGVYSPRVPQGWGSPSTAPPFPTSVPFAAPPSPAVELPPPAEPDLDRAPAGTLPDIAPGTASHIETVDGPPQRPQQPAPAATLFETPQETLKAMEERRKRGQSNYNTAARAWTDHDLYYKPVTFAQTSHDARKM